MTKTDVKTETGIRSYALFSEAAIEAMDIDAALTPYSQAIEHFGDVSMQVYDLGAAWENFRAQQERHFLEEEDGVWTYRHHINLPIAVVWEALTAPDLKLSWMVNMKGMTVDSPTDRLGVGSDYHCSHELADFRYWVTDWEPFSYFSTRIKDPAREGISLPETYHLTETETGTDLRYTIGQAVDADGNRSEVSEEEAVAFLSAFWPACFDNMNARLKLAS